MVDLFPTEIWLQILTPLARSSCYSQIVRTCKFFKSLFIINSKDNYLKFQFEHFIDISEEAKNDHKNYQGVSYWSYWSSQFWGKWWNKKIEQQNGWMFALRATLYYQDCEWRRDRYKLKVYKNNHEIRIHFDCLQISRIENSYYREFMNPSYLAAIFVVENHQPEYERTKVFVHYTKDQWKTTQIYEAAYCDGEREAFYDFDEPEEACRFDRKWKRNNNEKISYWEWRIDDESSEIWFAVQVQDTWLKTEHWDNNFGWNYRIVPKSISILPIETHNPYCEEHDYQ